MSGSSNASIDGRHRGSSIQRRRFIQATVIGVLTGLAGCSGDSPDTEGSNGDQDSTDTENPADSDPTTTPDQGANGPGPEETSTPEATDTPAEPGEDGTGTSQYEPREGCTLVTSTEIERDETVTVYPINGDPETEGMRLTYQRIDAEGQAEIRVAFIDGLTLDHYLNEGQRLDIGPVTGIELTGLGEDQIQVQFLRVPEEYDARSEWEPAEVELC
ncbi:uncharacterized protein Nmlp_1844 [Natronomonas moolapensis 8.8.11]|uniref:Uncharacterized protein n=1 Tax=Natronomonas moolapensis (strain DSM 18674 / CECT 7526 / JCM 14361 / 8.8.11) TaxID=268739 RepID=M1XKJ9_NATM8|nr:hypothetical protein [Natronomonas moolapensis]CCQ36032.1 uncharacterized protein Nmlp_1844 [Natronomonas moolapensis 8.8.11]